MQAHRKQVPAIKLAMNIAGHGTTGLNILRSHSKNSYTAVSEGLFELPVVTIIVGHKEKANS